MKKSYRQKAVAEAVDTAIEQRTAPPLIEPLPPVTVPVSDREELIAILKPGAGVRLVAVERRDGDEWIGDETVQGLGVQRTVARVKAGVVLDNGEAVALSGDVAFDDAGLAVIETADARRRYAITPAAADGDRVLGALTPVASKQIEELRGDLAAKTADLLDASREPAKSADELLDRLEAALSRVREAARVLDLTQANERGLTNAKWLGVRDGLDGAALELQERATRRFHVVAESATKVAAVRLETMRARGDRRAIAEGEAALERLTDTRNGLGAELVRLRRRREAAVAV
jgi:hypothetical protein